MRLTEQVHHHLEQNLVAGDIAIDATAGNGHDAAKIAGQIGPGGRLIAIDIQRSAIASTRQRLQASGLLEQSELHVGDHSTILPRLIGTLAEQVSAITFNLGYLPGSDKRIQTQSASTLAALDAARELLKPAGCLLVTAYRGHPGGLEEAEAVAEWMHQQAARNCTVRHEAPPSTSPRLPPVLWILEKP